MPAARKSSSQKPVSLDSTGGAQGLEEHPVLCGLVESDVTNWVGGIAAMQEGLTVNSLGGGRCARRNSAMVGTETILGAQFVTMRSPARSAKRANASAPTV